MIYAPPSVTPIDNWSEHFQNIIISLPIVTDYFQKGNKIISCELMCSLWWVQDWQSCKKSADLTPFSWRLGLNPSLSPFYQVCINWFILFSDSDDIRMPPSLRGVLYFLFSFFLQGDNDLEFFSPLKNNKQQNNIMIFFKSLCNVL